MEHEGPSSGEEEHVVVVTDANVIINFIHIGQLELLARLPGMRFVIPEHVVAEVHEPAQAAELHDFIESGGLERTRITEPAELERYAELSETLGKGESACLALAESRGWSLASDERRKFRRTVVEKIGEESLLTTPGLIVRAIRGGLATVAEADRWKATLEDKRFKMRFMSFSEQV